MKKTKTSISLIISCLIALVVCTCGFLFASVPLKQVSAAESETETELPQPDYWEQYLIDEVLNAEIPEYVDGMFVTTSYDDLEQTFKFQETWRNYERYIENKVYLSAEKKAKAEAQHEKYLKLAEPYFKYTKGIFEDAVKFYEKVKPLEERYADVKAADEEKYQKLKDDNIEFWGEGKTDEETAKNKIYASYFRVANDGTNENYTDTADNYVKKAIAIVDNGLNKAHAIATAPATMEEFKTRIEALPPIMEISANDEETLNKLKVELQEFKDKYAVHLDDEIKVQIENYQWIVDQSLDRITTKGNYTMLIIVGAIVAVGFGVYLLYKYVLSPWLKSKRGKRKE